jgi:phospholipase C
MFGLESLETKRVMATDTNGNGPFAKIQRYVVLMLENRSFDHLLGFLKSTNPQVMGLNGNESNLEDPNNPGSAVVPVARASTFKMTFDPAHEHYDVQMQLYGPQASSNPKAPPVANPPVVPAPMTGFVASALKAVDYSGDEVLVMECFQADQLPVISTLAGEFALFNFWYSSLPGPTWPNRFFIHAATSGGLTDSPSTPQIAEGFGFQNGTIYQGIAKTGKTWCIYHDGLPQSAGISSLRPEYIDPFTKRFQHITNFFNDVANGGLCDYTFIEPRYDTGNNYVEGNSMHPLNDIRQGESLVKAVYEALRKSNYWQNTMLVITFDEHGGFFDHLPPPATVPTGDDKKYANTSYSFAFDRLGVRVPGIVISAYTAKGTIIGTDPNDSSAIFDHTSVLATVEKTFGGQPLTNRDKAANTLDIAINLAAARLSPDDAPMTLPAPAADSVVSQAPTNNVVFAASPQAPLSTNQKSMADLALAVDLAVTDPASHAALISNHQKLVEQQDAADYIQQVATKITDRRANPPTQ